MLWNTLPDHPYYDIFFYWIRFSRLCWNFDECDGLSFWGLRYIGSSEINAVVIYLQTKSLKEGIELTPLQYIPGARIEHYLGHLNFFLIRESTQVRMVSYLHASEIIKHFLTPL